MASPSEPPEAEQLAAEVLELALSRPATLGAGRLIRIDGPAGSGKTTLGGALVRRARSAALDAQLIRMDDLYDGWAGLPRVADQLDAILTPLAAGEPGRYRRFDWEVDAYAESVGVPPCALLVIEGVGSGAAAFDALQTVLVWIEAPRDLRLARGLARDGEAFRPHWERWALDEQRVFERERTRERADVHADTGTDPPTR